MLACSWLRPAALCLAILAALLAPRVLVLRGVVHTDYLDFNDMPAHLANLDLLDALAGEAGRDRYFVEAPEQRRLRNPGRWPPGVYHAARPWLRAFGPMSVWTTQATNIFFACILLAGVVGLGAALGGLRVGLWAALLTALCPPLVASTWYFNLDFPLAAMILTGLLLLWRTRGFGRWRACLLFGLWSGLGLFTKPSYAMYLLVPSLWVLAQGLRVPGARRRALANLFLATAAVLAVVLTVQDVEPGLLWKNLVLHFTTFMAPPNPDAAMTVQPNPAWTVGWALKVPGYVLQSYTLPLLALALPGLALIHRRRAGAGQPPLAAGLRGLLLSFLWGTVVVLTVLPNTLERYVHPLYPLLCLLTVLWVAGRVPRRWQTPALLWISSAFAAVLVLVFYNPTPWAWGLQPTRDNLGAYEFRMPTPPELARFRDPEMHNSCRMGPLFRQVAALSRLEGSSRPLGVSFLRDPGKFPFPGLPLVSDELTLFSSQQIQDRMVFSFQLWLDRPLPPALVVLHEPGQQPERLRPKIQLVTRRRLLISCGQGRFKRAVELSLLRPLSPG